jgi:hypothetical protein
MKESNTVGLVWQRCIIAFLRVFLQGDWVETPLSPKTLCYTTILFLINTLPCFSVWNSGILQQTHFHSNVKGGRSNSNKKLIFKSGHKHQHILTSFHLHCYTYCGSTLLAYANGLTKRLIKSQFLASGTGVYHLAAERAASAY